MEEISRLFDTVLNIDFIRAVISNPREKDGIIKVKVRPLRKKDKLVFQFESFTAKQAFHKNLEKEEAFFSLSHLRQSRLFTRIWKRKRQESSSWNMQGSSGRYRSRRQGRNILFLSAKKGKLLSRKRQEK